MGRDHLHAGRNEAAIDLDTITLLLGSWDRIFSANHRGAMGVSDH